MSAWFQLEIEVPQLGSEPFQLGSAQLGKFQLKHITSIYPYFLIAIKKRRNIHRIFHPLKKFKIRHDRAKQDYFSSQTKRGHFRSIVELKIERAALKIGEQFR